MRDATCEPPIFGVALASNNFSDWNVLENFSKKLSVLM